MLLILKYNRRTDRHQLKRAGYTQRPYGDWIRWDGSGRWHIHKLQNGVYSIHYDLYVGDTHYAPRMPIATKEEIKRIGKASVTTRTKPNQEWIAEIFERYPHE